MEQIIAIIVAVVLVAAVGTLAGAILSSIVPSSSRNPMRRIYYRTRDGQADYRFGFQQFNDETWRVYILEQPSYRGRNDSAHVTHRLSDSGGRFICWNSPIRSFEEAKRVAAAWADLTQKYIRDGTRF